MGTAALPVLYHLVRRVQAKQVVFSSLMFLKMTPQEVVRRRRIQHWLLMAMRCLLLALLAFAFARPYIPRDQIPFVNSRQNQSVVLLIDNSFSMQYSDGSSSLLDEARERAVGLMSGAGDNDEYAVIFFSDETLQATPLDSDMAVHINAIENGLTPSFRTTDFYKPVRLAEEILEQATHEVKRIVLISDMQASGWLGAFENWKLDQSIDFEIISVGEVTRPNGYFDAFSSVERRVDGSVVHRFNARVGAGVEDELPLHTVHLDVEDDRIDEQRVGGDELQKASFQFRAPREGVFRAQVVLDQDPLRADDFHYFTFSVENQPSILGIGGNVREPSSSSYYLERAFNQGDRALYSFNAVNRNNSGRSDPINRRVLNDQDLVFLSLNEPTALESEALLQYVQEGGHVLVSFEDRMDINAHRRLMNTLGMGELQDVIHASTEQGFDAIIGEVDLKHPVFSVFSETGSGSIFRPRFRQYARISPDSTARVLSRYDTGDPFLIEKEIGKGRVLVYTSTLSPAWTDFPINELYIPFLYQVVKYVLSVNSVDREYFVGETVRLEARAGSEWDIRAPDNALYKATADENGFGYFRATDQPGHYVAANGGEQLIFSVNIDPRESVLVSRDLEEAYGAVVPPPDNMPVTIEEARLMELDDEERQQKFWRYVILFMVSLYALETFIANRKTK